MAITSDQVAVTSTGNVALNSTGNKLSLAVANRGGASVWLGSSGVSSTSGFELPAGDVISPDVSAADDLWVNAGSTVTVHVLRISGV